MQEFNFKNKKQSKVTVFTATFNRRYIINKLYKSLCNQTCFDFEWIVVDDGSTDNTYMFFNKIIFKNNRFKIKYIRVKHGGKHRAINLGVGCSNSLLFFIVDSDDYLANDAIDKIINVEKNIKNKFKFAGVCGPRHYSNKNLIGTTFKNGKYLDITYLEREKNFITGDKSEVFYTNILKKYSFPEFIGEDFLTEAVVWDRIAYDGFKMRYFNDMIYFCEYRKDGLTANINNIINNSPKGEALYIEQSLKFKKISLTNRIKAYWRFYLKQNDENKNIKFVSDCFKKNQIFIALIIYSLSVRRKLFSIFRSKKTM